MTILFVEIAGARFLAPYFGSSLYVWSALISVTLLSIAFGAWWGGRLADKKPDIVTLAVLWFCGAVGMGLISPLRSWVVPLTERMDLRVGVLITALVLYFIPLTLLSAIPPLAVKLADPSRERLGSTVGLFSALGTAGSFTGSILTGFVLVPNFGMTRLFAGFSVLMVLSGIFCAWKSGKKTFLQFRAVLGSGCLLLFSGGAREEPGKLGQINPLLRVQLLYSVISAGLTVLFVEIAGARFLAPYFGSSLYVWSALISVTLLSIAFGAWWGGRLADRKPDSTTLAVLWFCGALGLGLIPPLRSWVVPLTERMDLRVGVLITALVLYFIPLTLLSAIPPLAVKLADPSRERLGSTVGLFSALGTAGSFTGSLVTGFVLVPNFGMTRLFAGFSVLLVLLGIFCFWKSGKKAALIVGAILWTGGLLLFSGGAREGLGKLGNMPVVLVAQKNSLYGQLKVADMGRYRMLLMDSVLQGGVVWPSGRTLYPYAGYMEALGLATVPKARRMLVIGLGAGIIPTWLEKKGYEVEVVEINPQMAGIARDWFGLKAPPIVLHIEDGRRFVHRAPAASYDLVFLDVFSGEEVPYHLLTEEAFAEVKRTLRPGGAFVINYVAYRETPKTRVTATLVKALGTSFGQVDVFAAGQPGKLNNLILVAVPERRPYSPVPPAEVSPTEVMTIDQILGERVELAQPYDLRLIDDHAPMEWLDREVRFAWRREVLEYFGSVIKGI